MVLYVTVMCAMILRMVALLVVVCGHTTEMVLHAVVILHGAVVNFFMAINGVGFPMEEIMRGHNFFHEMEVMWGLDDGMNYK